MSKNKSITIEKLKWFISEGKIQGWVSHVWFNCLVSKFPIEFLFLSQSSSDFEERRILIKNRFLDIANLKIQKLLEFNLEQEDVDYLNSTIKQLSDRISKKENQNEIL